MSAKSSITGRFVTAMEAILHPESTYTVKPPRPSADKQKCPTCHGSGYVSSDQEVGEMTPEQLAQRFHETYERLAPEFGYKTREESAVPWAEVPETNKQLMIAVCSELQKEATI